MSTTTDQTFHGYAIHAAALQAPCAKCHALPGVACVTSTGKPTRMHEVRRRPIRAIYHLGLTDGAADVLTTARVYVDRAQDRVANTSTGDVYGHEAATARANAVRGLYDTLVRVWGGR